MASLFGTFGSYELPRDSGSVSRHSLKLLWKEVSAEPGFADLSSAMGVYVLTTKVRNGHYLPWYVGLTRTMFLKRFYQHGHNSPSSPFMKLAEQQRRGSIYVFLFPRKTSDMKLMKHKVGSKKRVTKVNSIRELEFLLIGRCLAANKNLLNVSEKTFQEGFIVPGVLNDDPKKRDQAARTFATVIGV